MGVDCSFQESDLSLHPLGSLNISIGGLLLLSVKRAGWIGRDAGDKASCWVKLAVLTQSRTFLRWQGGEWRGTTSRICAFWNKSAFFNLKRHFATTEIKHLLLLAVITSWTTILAQKGIYYPVAVLTLH